MDDAVCLNSTRCSMALSVGSPSKSFLPFHLLRMSSGLRRLTSSRGVGAGGGVGGGAGLSRTTSRTLPIRVAHERSDRGRPVMWWYLVRAAPCSCAPADPRAVRRPERVGGASSSSHSLPLEESSESFGRRG